MSAMSAKSKPSSTASHRAAGRKASLVWLDPEDREIIVMAAKLDGRPVTQFLSHHALQAAKRIVAKQ